MSTIASPRDSSVTGRRIPLISTPTSSSRPSLELPRSVDNSPNPSGTPSTLPPKRNRAALREYYNLKKNAAPSSSIIPEVDAASETSSIHSYAFSDVAESELDKEGFDAEAYVKKVLREKDLKELLVTYGGVLREIGALEAEKKALVYDNYSKLISATEMIGRLRGGMDPLDPMARTLDPAVEGIFRRAEEIREGMRRGLPEGMGKEVSREDREVEGRRKKTRDVVVRVLETPERVRILVADGKVDEARRVWEPALKLLQRWKERGVGGVDVVDCIEDGEAALRGEPADEKSWVNVRNENRDLNS
ncbi:uncharacterized protein LY89DRAFT_686460 [Mollisia scopiformis]|uniref:Vacuolar protein sorting-associated protein 51 homolog n=1 Tax=Mollisia scopiformis TaxID=149040 RepID=A0A194X3Q3_MOLSC|nr:uncharacterized protein LY89DRAFT_686460 [Mollisia scopiformis]KUJ14820.1 hypothetical protein LY89DRAFT_686460 [Mollisia scopiformis]